MEKNRIVKGVTLLTFVGLIAVFVAYRSGRFSPKNATDSSEQPKEVTDTIPPETTFIPSSKSMIIKDLPTKERDTSIEESLPEKIDKPIIPSSKSGPILEPRDLNNVPKPDKDFVIPSSKSGIIFEPDDLDKVELDSILLEGLEQQPQQQNQQQND